MNALAGVVAVVALGIVAAFLWRALGVVERADRKDREAWDDDVHPMYLPEWQEHQRDVDHLDQGPAR